MPKTFVQILKEIAERKRNYFENYPLYAEQIKEKAKELLGKDVRVLVFGSIVKGDWKIDSDIDLLVISDKLSPDWLENRKIRTELKRTAGSFSPFQIHLATPEEFKNWYKRFIRDDYIEI